MAYITRASGYSDFNSNASSASGFIPELYEGKFIETLYEEVLATTLLTTEYSGQISKKGDSVLIPTEPSVTINDYTIGVDLTAEHPTSTAKNLTITEAKAFMLDVDDVDEFESHVDIMAKYAEVAAKAMGKEVDTEVLQWLGNTCTVDSDNKGATAGEISSKYALGVTGTPVTITTSNALQKILDAAGVLDEQQVPREGRWIVIPSLWARYLKETDIAKSYLTGDSKSPLRSNARSVGNIDGMEIFVSNNVYTASSEWWVPFGDKYGAAFASQINKTKMGEYEKRFASYIKGLNVYGYAVLDGTRLGQMCVDF
jgi:hypothetical protein